MPKKKPTSNLRKLLLAASSLVAALALSLGAKYYVEGLPKYAVGDCFLDQAQGVAGQVKGIRDGKYQLLVQIMVFVVPAEVPIREFNKMNLPKINCETGEPIDAKANR